MEILGHLNTFKSIRRANNKDAVDYTVKKPSTVPIGASAYRMHTSSRKDKYVVGGHRDDQAIGNSFPSIHGVLTGQIGHARCKASALPL